MITQPNKRRIFIMKSSELIFVLTFCLVSIVLSSCASVSNSSAFEEGMVLYESKDYQGAFKSFLSCARNGGLSCINNIGIMYENGHLESGKSSTKRAVDWYNLAANSGNLSAINNLKSKEVYFDES